MCFLAELLAVFEVQKPDIIKPVHTLDLTGTYMLLLLYLQQWHWMLAYLHKEYNIYVVGA